MTWPGWEGYQPPGTGTAPVDCTAKPKRSPRVKNYVKTWVDERAGIVLEEPPDEERACHSRLFDSKREANRYVVLLQHQREHLIWDLQCQVSYPLNVVGPRGQVETIAHYVADFVYKEQGGVHGRTIIEDCKGFKTELYRRSKRHFEIQYGRKIAET